MNAIDFVLKFVLFELFFWLCSAPLYLVLVLLPPDSGVAGIGHVLRVSLGLALGLWLLVGASALAFIAARRSTYEFDTPIQAVRYAINEARIKLSLLPFVGTLTAPKVTASGSAPKEPR